MVNLHRQQYETKYVKVVVAKVREVKIDKNSEKNDSHAKMTGLLEWLINQH